MPTCITPTRGTGGGVGTARAEQAPTRPAHRTTLSSTQSGRPRLHRNPSQLAADGDYSNGLDAQREDPGNAEVLSRPLDGGMRSRQKEQWPGSGGVLAAASRRPG